MALKKNTVKKSDHAKKTDGAKNAAGSKRAPLIAPGRGLEALLALQGVARPTQYTENVSLDDIEPDPYQPRRTFNPESIDCLAESIKNHGLLNPLIVAPTGSGQKKYRIVAGERRYRACLKNGMKDVLVCVIRGIDERLRSEIALVENLQREDLSPLEAASGIKQFIEKNSLTQENAAKRLGIARTAIANKLRLLTLPDAVKSALAEGKLSEGHAKVLLGLKNDEARMIKLADDCVRQGWSVRTLTEKCSAEPPAPKNQSTAWKPEGIAQLNKKLGFKIRTFSNRMVLTGVSRGQIMRICALLDRESGALTEISEKD